MYNESNKSPLEEICQLFLSQGVEFLIIGGQAEYLFGSPRVTMDVDLCYRRDTENLRRLATCLQAMGAKLRNVPPEVKFLLDHQTLKMGCNFTFSTQLGDLDLLGEVEPLGGYEAILAHHEEYDFGGYVVRTIGLEDLLRVKLHINRVKDQESIVQLQAIKRLRQQEGQQKHGDK